MFNFQGLKVRRFRGYNPGLQAFELFTPRVGPYQEQTARMIRRPVVIILTLVLLLATAPGYPADAQSDERCFPETGLCAGGRFLEYWEANGGLPQQGFPITGVIEEQSRFDGKTYRVQYFERARFEEHSDNT